MWKIFRRFWPWSVRPKLEGLPVDGGPQENRSPGEMIEEARRPVAEPTPPVGKKIKEHFSEEKMLRRRIFSTSPYLSLLLPKPENGQTRHMLKYNNKALLGKDGYWLIIFRHGEEASQDAEDD